MKQVYIDGSAGTTGLRIYERLALREDISLLSIPEELRKDNTARAERMNAADIVFLCLPDAAALEAEGLLTNPDTCLIDTSTAHRTAEGWCYGFPELSPLHREAILRSRRISVPGCHASGFTALVYPLRAGGFLSADYPLVCYSITGYSGGGKAMIAQYEDAERAGELDSPRQYGTTQQHKHLKEMVFITHLNENPIFAPIVADYYSGMTVSIPLHTRLLNRRCTPADLRSYLKEYYADQPLIHVSDEMPAFLGANALSGRDSMELFVGGNNERILLAACFDNLGKGASGAAIQCMNLRLGLPETTGLVL